MNCFQFLKEKTRYFNKYWKMEKNTGKVEQFSQSGFVSYHSIKNGSNV